VQVNDDVHGAAGGGGGVDVPTHLDVVARIAAKWIVPEAAAAAAWHRLAAVVRTGFGRSDPLEVLAVDDQLAVLEAARVFERPDVLDFADVFGRPDVLGFAVAFMAVSSTPAMTSITSPSLSSPASLLS
jgi:hypothetical protein